MIKIKLIKLSLLIACLLVVSGCTTTSLSNKATSSFMSLPINHGLLNTDISVINEQQLFTLTAEQQQTFLKFYQHKLEQNTPRHQIIADFINAKLGSFTYYGETYSAQETLTKNKGNCMSLAILTTALAKLINIEIGYREVNTQPIFEKHKNILLSSTHVQTLLYDPDFVGEENMVYFNKPAIVIDYFPNTSNIGGYYLKYNQFVGMYYQNIAADALVANDLDKAFAYALKGIEFDNSSLKLLNTLAVIHRRSGDLSAAQQLYLTGLTFKEKNLALLNNYIVLLKKQHQELQAAALEEKLEDLDDPNPYTWLEQAYIAHNKHNYAKAAKYYLKTLHYAPYVHQAYIGLYQIYLKNHQPKKAQAMLEKALEWTHEFEQRKLYKMKLYQLYAKH